jgi:hypothetical protein
MIRTQISLTEEQMLSARAVAKRRGISLAQLVRTALDDLLESAPEEAIRARAIQAVGGFRSGRSDTSVDHDDALASDGRW